MGVLAGLAGRVGDGWDGKGGQDGWEVVLESVGSFCSSLFYCSFDFSLLLMWHASAGGLDGNGAI